MDILQSIDAEGGLTLKRGNGFHGSSRTGQGGHRWNGVIECGPAQVFVVMGSLAANGGVDHQLHLVGPDQVLDVGATFMDFEHSVHRQPRLRQDISGA